MFRTMVIGIVILLSTGCATVIKGTTQTIPVSSDPPGADIEVDGQLVGTTPQDVEMKRKRDHLVTLSLEGYQSKSMPMVRDVGGAVWGNILAGGLIGWGVDATSGAQYNLSPKVVHVKLIPKGEGTIDDDDGALATTFITKLNELDQLLEEERVTKEEYAEARKALFKEYYPEMLPEEEQEKGDDADSE